MREKIRKWAPPIITIAITIFIFYMSSRPAGQSDEISLETTKTAVGIWSLLPFFDWSAESMQELAYMLNPIMRKVAHFVEFAMLGISAFLTMKSRLVSKKIKSRIMIAWGYCATVAILDETLQLFVDGRHGSIEDVLLDSIGAIIGMVVFYILGHIRQKNRPKTSDCDNKY